MADGGLIDMVDLQTVGRGGLVRNRDAVKFYYLVVVSPKSETLVF